MKCVVEKGKTLLVDGPASVTLTSGAAEVLGALMNAGDRVVVREGKRMPFKVKRRATFNLMLGENSFVEETNECTVPPSWKKASEEILSYGKPSSVVMVIGGVDTGKTSFCTYLTNMALKTRQEVAIIDGDLGQSDIGPPSTIGFRRVNTPIKDLFDLRVENAYFVGATSPSRVTDKVITGLVTLKNKALEMGIRFVVINTDGWVEGEDAVRYKVQLAKTVSPDIVVGIQQADELTPILTALREVKVISIKPSHAVRKRDRNRRKILRELSYRKYLKGAKIRVFPMSWVRVEGMPIGAWSIPDSERLERIRTLLDADVLCYGETADVLFIVLKKNQWVYTDRVRKVRESFGKTVRIIREGDEEGLLVALQNEHGEFLGIGILDGIDHKRRVMKVYTPITTKVAAIRIGQVKLDREGREIGVAPIFVD